jgi:peptide/nickel transport system substrate-binding protein
MYIGWNLNNPLFQNKRIRYALSSAIDVDEMINKYLYGLGERVTGSILKIHWAYNDKITPIPYNIETAKSILASEGWVDTDGDGWIDKNGKKFSFSLITNPARMNIATYIQSQFAKLGIEVIPKPLEWNVSQTEIYSRRFDAYYGGWRMPFTVNPKQGWHSSEADRKESLNYISYRNTTIDSLIDTGIKTLNKEKSIYIWNKFQQIIYDEQPYTFLYSPLAVNAVNKRVRDVKADVRGMYVNLDEWWIPIKERRKQ